MSGRNESVSRFPERGGAGDALAIHNRKVKEPGGLEMVEFDAGETVFQEGDFGDRLYVVRSGLVEISKKIDGHRVVVGYVGGGEIFGELALLDGERRMGTARATLDTVCAVMPQGDLRRRLAHSDPFVREIVGVLARGIRSLTADWVAHRD
jgi:CRP/FNR family cyclic AMP-dependent transcriptional regulator